MTGLWTVIRYRWLQALVVVSLAALVTACAVFAPLYDRAIQQATVRTRLHDAPVQVSGLQVRSSGSADSPALDVTVLEDLLPRRVRPYFLPAIPSITLRAARWPINPRFSPTGPILWRQGACRHVRFVSGRCPRSVDDVAVSRADERTFGWHVGSRIQLAEPGDVDTDVQSKFFHLRMRVVGVYSVLRGPYWYGDPPVGRSGTPDQDTGAPQVDAWLTDRATMDSAFQHWVNPVTQLDEPLDKSAVGIDEIVRIGPVVDRLLTTVASGSSGEETGYSTSNVSASSGLPDIAHAARRARDQAGVTVPLLMVQLALLAVVVLWLVLGAATEQRRPEVAVARLRGRGAGGARRMLLLELGCVVLAGVPVGVVVALVLSWLARNAYLPLRPPFELGRGFLVAVVGVVVVLAVVTMASVQQVVREPVSALLRRVPARRTTWTVGAIDAMLVAACTTAVVAFVTGELNGPLALAAPALLALLVGLVLAHLLVPVAAGVGHRLLTRGRVAAGVSALHVSRRPATRRVVTIVTVATALLVFSADALAVGMRNRQYAAEQEIGAPLVATVAGSDVTDVRAALHDVDPAGRSVTPVLRISPPGAAGTATEAVVPGQFAHIALLPGQSASSVPWTLLRPPAVPALHLVGTSLSMTLASHVTTTAANAPSGTVRLSLDILGPDKQTQWIGAAELPDGDGASRLLRLAVPCAAGCDLTGLELDTDPSHAAAGSFTLSDLTTSTGQHVVLSPAHQWLAAPDGSGGSMQPARSARRGGLVVSFWLTGADAVLMDHASVPRRLPALVAGSLPPGSSGRRFAGLGLDGVDRSMTRAGTLLRAPAAPADTAVVNLDVLQRDGAVPDPTASLQVWFARDDPALLARVTRSLHAHGASVSTTSSVSGARRTLDRSAAAWSLQLGLLVGVAGLLVAALVLVVVAATTWRLRSRDFAALRMSGLSRTQISLVAAGEQVPVVALAVLVGGVCGLLGAHFAMPSVPLFPTAPQVSTLDLGTAWTVALGAAALALLVLSAVGWAAAWSLARRADLGRVRESL